MTGKYFPKMLFNSFSRLQPNRKISQFSSFKQIFFFFFFFQKKVIFSRKYFMLKQVEQTCAFLKKIIAFDYAKTLLKIDYVRFCIIALGYVIEECIFIIK